MLWCMLTLMHAKRVQLGGCHGGRQRSSLLDKTRQDKTRQDKTRLSRKLVESTLLGLRGRIVNIKERGGDELELLVQVVDEF